MEDSPSDSYPRRMTVPRLLNTTGRFRRQLLPEGDFPIAIQIPELHRDIHRKVLLAHVDASGLRKRGGFITHAAERAGLAGDHRTECLRFDLEELCRGGR